MCGATSAQNNLAAAQTQFYTQMTQEQDTVFGEDQGILSAVTKATEPIIAAGADQQGFGPQELQALNSESGEGVATGFNQAEKALNEQTAAEGGSGLPQGAAMQQKQELATEAEGMSSAEKQQITEANYATGRQNYDTAVSELEGAEGLNEATGYAGAANTAGSAAGQTDAQIASENDSIWTGIEGALGGVAGAAVGNLNTGPFGGGTGQ
jgi:hypothetical protein